MTNDNLFLYEITKDNINIFNNLAQAYEAEFSRLTNKLPNEYGWFEIDTIPKKPYIGYLLYLKNIPIGFCIASINERINDIAEFYIIPSLRFKKMGHDLAFMIFNKHPGRWQVRQIEGADNATAFWRKIIMEISNNNYTESIISDPQWGTVIRQQFIVL